MPYFWLTSGILLYVLEYVNCGITFLIILVKNTLLLMQRVLDAIDWVSSRKGSDFSFQKVQRTYKHKGAIELIKTGKSVPTNQYDVTFPLWYGLYTLRSNHSIGESKHQWISIPIIKAMLGRLSKIQYAIRKLTVIP